jgi:hypothetical protein
MEEWVEISEERWNVGILGNKKNGDFMALVINDGLVKSQHHPSTGSG